MPHTPVRVGTALADDGGHLDYRVEGEGPGPALLCSNGIGVSTFFWRRLARTFAPTHQVVTWDYRGHGESPAGADPDGLTVDRCARDLWAVADRAGVQEAVLLGHSMGCQVALEAYRRHPSRVLGYIPMFGSAGGLGSGSASRQGLEALFRLGSELGTRFPEAATRALRTTLQLPGMWQAVRALGMVHPDLCPREEFAPYFEHLSRLDLRSYFALVRDLLSHDATPLLPAVRVPTLVIAGENDLFAPASRSRAMADAIPGAELLVVRGGTHATLVEQPELIALAVAKFLRTNGLDAPGRRSRATSAGR